MIKELEDTELVRDTSWHGYVVLSSINKLTELFGEPYNEGDETDKVQYEWNLEYDNIPFTIYDWKEYRKINPYEIIDFHLGTKTQEDSDIVHKAITKAIKNGTNS